MACLVDQFDTALTTGPGSGSGGSSFATPHPGALGFRVAGDGWVQDTDLTRAVRRGSRGA